MDSLTSLLYDFMELLSLGATIPCLTLSFMVVVYWWKPFIKVFKSFLLFRWDSLTSPDWFVIGVTVGFMASQVDNFYWGLAWTSEYLELPTTDALFKNGVISNIPFRQFGTAIAAYCHVRSALEHMFQNEFSDEVKTPRYHEEIRNLNRVVNISILAGCVIVLCLVGVKSYIY